MTKVVWGQPSKMDKQLTDADAKQALDKLEVERLYADILTVLRSYSSREMSIAITNVETARLWSREYFKHG